VIHCAVSAVHVCPLISGKAVPVDSPRLQREAEMAIQPAAETLKTATFHRAGARGAESGGGAALVAGACSQLPSAISLQPAIQRISWQRTNLYQPASQLAVQPSAAIWWPGLATYSQPQL